MKMTLAIVLVAMTAMVSTAQARSYTQGKTYDLYDVFQGTDNKCLVTKRLYGTETVGGVTKNLGVSDKTVAYDFTTGNRTTYTVTPTGVTNISVDNDLSNADINYSKYHNSWNITYSTKSTSSVRLYHAEHDNLLYKHWTYYTSKGTPVTGIALLEANTVDCDKIML